MTVMEDLRLKVVPGAEINWRRRDAWIAIALIALTLLIALVTVYRAPEYSRYDEYTHADYAWKISHGHIPAAGDQVDTPLLIDWSCRGDRKSIPPACDSPEAHDPFNFAYDAYNYNYFHPPLYYGIAGAIATPVSELTGIAFVTVARLVSATLIALGVGALYLAIRSWRLSETVAMTAAGMVIATPMVGHIAAIVNPDAVTILVGAGVVWLLGRIYLDNRVPILGAALLMLLAAGSKVIIAIPVVAMCVYVGIDGLRRWIKKTDTRRGQQMVAMAAVCAVILIGVYVGWAKFQAGRGDPNWMNPMDGLSTAEFNGSWPPLVWVSTSLVQMFGIGRGYWTHEQINTWGTQFAGQVLALVTTVTPVLALAVLSKASKLRIANWVLLMGFVLVPLVVQIQALLDQGKYFPSVTTRYALALLPVSALLTAALIERLGWEKPAMVMTGIVGISYLASVAGLL